jgi:hypothetical protein
VPKIFLDVIITWYSDMTCRVKWGNNYSDWFDVTSGVRQGGVLSPNFYCLYVDDPVLKMSIVKIGCYILEAFVAALMYADDMALLAPSVKGLQALLWCCESYCEKWDICLNPKKSKLMFFGKGRSTSFSPTLSGKSLVWVDCWTYLGIDICSGKAFSCSVSDKVKKYYKCANAILRIDGHCDEIVMLRLLESHCLPILTYGIEVIFVADPGARRQLRVAYKSMFRHIFDYRFHESVTNLQGALVRPTWEELVERSVQI